LNALNDINRRGKPKTKGNTYVISDIHGRFKALNQLLIKGRVDPSKDRLYFLGDYVDWGRQSLEVLRYVKLLEDSYENVHCTIGNHDYFCYKCLLGEGDRPSELNGGRFDYIWEINGMDDTLRQLSRGYNEELEDIAKWLENLPIQYEVDVKNRKYVLTHSSPELFGESKEILAWKRVNAFHKKDWERFEEIYGDAILVSGHTIANKFRSFVDAGQCKVFFDENHPYINVDCGAKAIGISDYAGLALLRLDDYKTWYSDLE
jgi:predicted MPP superfamily phosphohydrolase